MKRFLKGLVVFFSVSILLYLGFSYFVLPHLLEATNGPNTVNQLNMSFANAKRVKPELVIMGNSRMYCGINPDYFTKRAYNFSHNSDTYNQLYWKLDWLFKQGIQPKVLVLGTDYFQFSFISGLRNEGYGPLLGPEYLADYKKSKYDWILRQRNVLNPRKVRKLVKGPNYYQSLKPNGQYVRTGVATEEDFIKRDAKRKEIQVGYFEKTLAVCKQRGIEVFIVMCPLRDIELKQYKPGVIEEFNQFITKYLNNDVHYLDYSKIEGFGMEDYIDFSHLNPKAADKFSVILNRDVEQILSSKNAVVKQ